jgi:hypothetical protein
MADDDPKATPHDVACPGCSTASARMADMPKPSETVPFVLRYEGPDVEDGSMSIEDIVPVLQGFASAYGKIASEQGVGVQHRIRITGVERGSANILLEVWDALGKMADPLTSASILVGAAGAIVSAIVGVIQLKKHVKNQPHSTRITGHDTISVINSSNVTLEMPVNVYNIFRAQVIDTDIAKVVKPLERGRIDAAEIIATTGTMSIRERIDASERQYLEASEVVVTSTRETWITGKLNSLTKTTEAGFMYLTDGTRVSYQWVGPAAGKLHQIFGTYDGVVRVFGVAHLDENLKPTRIEVSDIEKVQGHLFDDSPTADEGVERDG